jgi:TonB family protein
MVADMIPVFAGGWHPRTRLGTALLASLALHLGLAQQLSYSQGSSERAAAAQAIPLQARFIAADRGGRTSGEAIAGRDAGMPGQAAARVPAPEGGEQASRAKNAGAIEIGREPRYFLSSQLDRRPVALAPIEPEYPASAGPEGAYLVLRLRIGESGAVDAVRVLVSDSQRLFDDSAIAAFGRARFSPGIRNGVPVKSQMYIELKYLPRIPPQTGARAPDAGPAAPRV